MARLADLVVLVLCVGAAAAQTFMERDGSELKLGGQKVFLGGVDAVGGDVRTEEQLNELMDSLLEAGGNTLRVAVPGSGRSRVTALQRLLTRAAERHVLVLLLLWPAQDQLPEQPEQLEMLVSAVVRPMAERLRPYQALGGWQVAEQTSCLSSGQRRAVEAVEAAIREEDKKALIVRTARPGCDDYDSADVVLSHNGPLTADLPTVQIVECCDDVSQQMSRARETQHGALASHACWEEALAGMADDFRLAFPPRRQARSWYKRPKLIYNPDEDLQDWVRKDKEDKENKEDKEGTEGEKEDSGKKHKDTEKKDNVTAKKE